MAIPIGRDRRRADQVHDRVPLGQQGLETDQVGQAAIGAACPPLERRGVDRVQFLDDQGRDGVGHQAAFARRTWASKAVSAPGVTPSIRAAWPRVKGFTRVSFSRTSFDRLPTRP
jgi:hypothetical protein